MFELYAVLGGVRHQPCLGFAIALYISSRHVLGMVRDDGGQPGALEQGDLGGRVSGRYCTDPTRFQHSYPAARTGQQQRGGQTR